MTTVMRSHEIFAVTVLLAALQLQHTTVTYSIPLNPRVRNISIGENQYLPNYPFTFKDVKIISLGKANHVVSHPRGNVPWNLTEVRGLNAEGKPENVSHFNYETLWNNGSLTLTLVLVEKKTNLGPERVRQDIQQAGISEEQEDIQDINFPILQSDIEAVVPDFRRHRRQKRRIFGLDSRMYIPSSNIHKFPFSAIVHISTGCTGTLISDRHVLTAAHCVHDSSNYIVSAKDIKIGFQRPKRKGKVRWAHVEYIKVPRGWTTDKDVSYDYAVLKLRHKHRRQYMIPGSIILSRGHINIHFLGFHEDKPKNSLWYSFCLARPLDHVILSRCDAKPGSSGASVYMLSYPTPSDTKVDRIVVGVLSGSGTVRFRNRRARRFNIATKLTPLKAGQICSWAKSAPYCDTVA